MSSNQASSTLLQKEKRKREETTLGENENHHHLTKRSNSEETTKRQKLAGPASLPVEAKDHEDKSCTPVDDSNSSSDDEIGPRLPPRDNSQPASGIDDHTHRDKSTDQNECKPPSSEVSQRDEWMILPPDKQSWMSNIDPTALRGRKFNTARSAQTSARGGRGPSTAWTENPAQKKIRLENEVLGIQDPSRSDQQGHASGPSKVDDATAERIRSFNVSLCCPDAIRGANDST